MFLSKSSVLMAIAHLCVICSCAIFHSWLIQVKPSKSAIPNQTPTTTWREYCYTIRAWPIPYPLSNPRCSRTDGRLTFWRVLLITSFIAECLGNRPALNLQDKPCKPLLSVCSPQHQEWGIQTSAPTLRAMGTIKLSEFSSVPSYRTGKALGQAPLSFCTVASNLALDTWSVSRNYFPNFS